MQEDEAERAVSEAGVVRDDGVEASEEGCKCLVADEEGEDDREDGEKA